MPTSAKIDVMLVTAPTECPKCVKCEALVRDLQAQYPEQIDFRKVPADSPETADISVIMPPMLIVNDLIVCAGRVPLRSSLEKLIAQQLEELSEAQ